MYKRQISYVIPLSLFAGLLLIYLLILKKGIVPALVWAALPAVIVGLLSVVQKYYVFYAYFILNYFILGLSRYIPLKGGLIMLVLACGILTLILLKSMVQKLEWERCRNFLTATWGIWAVYCTLELLNPRALWEPWTIAFPNYAFYPLFCALVVPLLFTRYKNFQWLLILWAGLTLLAAAKGYWQRNRGFDSAELHWLLVEGGARTHFIHTGIRYFSFFTDAAAYGASMGVSMVVFGISGFYTPTLWKKLLFWGSAFGAAYGLMISGTRSDLAIPFVGMAVYLVLCRNIRAILASGFLLICAFIFLNYTTLGDNNRFIHRMRTSLDFKDASWKVRVTNRERIYRVMQDKPFGTGLGLAGTKAKRFRPINEHDPLTYVATDSWYVMTYIETGIVGLVLYLGVLLAILMKATFIASFRIRHKELQGQLFAIIGAIAGILVTCYANEVLNYPNGIIVYTLMAFLFTAPYYDKELRQHESHT